MSRAAIKLTPAEIQSGLDRQRAAEGLIEQLPKNHDGRNTWLMNFGVKEEAVALRAKGSWPFDTEYKAIRPHVHMAGDRAGKTIDECAECGCDIRHPIHSGVRR
jgi:hypothetical protein